KFRLWAMDKGHSSSRIQREIPSPLYSITGNIIEGDLWSAFQWFDPDGSQIHVRCVCEETSGMSGHCPDLPLVLFRNGLQRNVCLIYWAYPIIGFGGRWIVSQFERRIHDGNHRNKIS